MATIQIQRTNEFNNRIRDFHIFIDGEKAGTIANGETRNFRIAAGQHSVVAKIDWCSSPERIVNINAGETKTLKVGGFKHSVLLMYYTVFAIVLHLALSATMNIEWTRVLILPALLLIVYFLTLGRDEYLTLTEL